MSLSAEAGVLRAIIEGNQDQAAELLRDFLPGELKALYHQAHTMAGLCELEHKRQFSDNRRGTA